MSEGRIYGFDALSDNTLVEDEADVVIIGTGASGAPAARVLAGAGLDVVLIEEGPYVPPEARKADQYSAFKQTWRDMGFQVARGKNFLPVLQGSCVGGSTTINGAIVHRLPEPIHKKWVDEHGVGKEMTYARLGDIFDQLDVELSVAPGPEDILGNNNKLMRRGADALGMKSNVIERNVKGCKGSVRCLTGCPTAQKQSMEVTYIPYAVERGARVYSTCRAEKLLREAGRAVGVEGTFRRPITGDVGPKLRVRARKGVFVAASAIQTPLFLLDNKVGQRSKLVGRRLQLHPGSGMMAVFDEPVKIWFGATQGYESTHYWDEYMKFETVGVPLEVGAGRLPGYGYDLMQRIADYQYVASWGVQIRAEAMGRVKRNLFGGKSITYAQTPLDIQRLKLGLKRLAEMMFAAGASHVYPGIHGIPETITSPAALDKLDELPDDPRLFHGIASHIFGTAKMGTEESNSVVNELGECHDVKGLYVVDSSIFPTNMGVNPAHTISAISWFIAERFANA